MDKQEKSNKATDFYADYGRFKAYQTPKLNRKQIARFDREFWDKTGCTKEMAVLEVGCGCGLFLSYLLEKGVGDFLGVDLDPGVRGHLPDGLSDKVVIANIQDYLDSETRPHLFDRIVMYDVLEHFTPDEGVALLRRLKSVLRRDGKILLRVPNMESPWGAKYQFGDLTHKTAYTPSSLRQAALAGGFICVSCFPHLEGSPNRQFLDRLFHRILSRLLMSPPEIWSANVFAILEPTD
jgi:cyclopropane fatty-acyl-phospholipid synthase-like methyltransferase